MERVGSKCPSYLSNKNSQENSKLNLAKLVNLINN